jgi:putative endopeptidase
MEQTRSAYRAHLESVFELLGETQELSHTSAEQTLAIEIALAQAELTPLERRDRQSYYHPMIAADLQRLARTFPWPRYFGAIGFSPAGEMNVAIPRYMQAIDALMKTTPLPAWKSYLRWELVRLITPGLPAN